MKIEILEKQIDLGFVKQLKSWPDLWSKLEILVKIQNVGKTLNIAENS